MSTATRTREKKFSIDTWTSGQFPVIRTSRQTVLVWLLGAPALAPLALELPGVIQALVTGNGDTAHQTGNDVLGSGGALLLFSMLSITPLRTLTRRQWFVPLRRWYGVVFGFTIFLDAIEASNDTAFNGPVGAKLAGHTFLLLGLTMTLLLIPLTVQGIWNQWSMRQLGKYWKPFQKFGTYTIWGLLCAHLILLEGFGLSRRVASGPDKFPFDLFHARLYDYLSCSALMLVLRLPLVRRWVRAKQNAGKTREVWLTIAPLVLLFLLAYGYFVNELFYKGIAAFTLNPIND
jgi:DMSO/TMAO reductase YedYZ heme-binding membrane subunit